MNLNTIYNENNLETMKRMPDSFIDLTVTSPPYDGLRTYNTGMAWSFSKIAKELYRVTKPGGIVVWIVGDQTIDFCETLSSFKQAIYFVEECGFNLLDTMIYVKKSYAPAYPNMKRYAQTFEYMYVFSKGKPNTFNPIKVDKQISSICEREEINGYRQTDGSIKYKKMKTANLTKDDCNVWVFDVGFNKSSKDKCSFKHPATFPEQLANDHILTWTNEGDLVYDCFMGAATTAKMAIINKRKWIGSEISAEYCGIAHERLKQFDNDIFLNSFEKTEERGQKIK